MNFIKYIGVNCLYSGWPIQLLGGGGGGWGKLPHHTPQLRYLHGRVGQWATGPGWVPSGALLRQGDLDRRCCQSWVRLQRMSGAWNNAAWGCCTPSMVGGKSIDTALFNRGPLEKDLENVSHRGQGIRRTTSGYPKLSVSSSPGEKTHVKSELFLINFYI